MSTNYKPILFSTEMVKAILEGRKTKTRRIIKNSHLIKNPDNYKLNHLSIEQGFANFLLNTGKGPLCPVEDFKYGKPGDVLWVRETFADNWEGLDEHERFYENGEKFPQFTHKADCLETWTVDGEEYKISDYKWKPSIHMPKEACRLFLKIKDVRVERLHYITQADAIAEGVELHKRGIKWLNYLDQKHGLTQFIYNLDTAKQSFITLWKLINGEFSWNKNPWVWVIEFERIEKPQDFNS